MSMLKKVLLWGVSLLTGLVALLLVLAYATTFHPADVQPAEVTCPSNAPKLKPGQPLKILSWNVQYMASKQFVFYYDKLDNSGPDLRPTPEAIAQTFEDVARIIGEEKPDVLLLQEVDDGAGRTDEEDQLARLLAMLSKDYVCHASAFYWKASFIPHPKIMGPVGMKLSTISKYQISEATRHQLPMYEQDPLTDMFYLKRAVLEAKIPIDGDGAKPLVTFNTHLDAFAQGTNTMELQVNMARDLFAGAEKSGNPWLGAGDFNLLATRSAWEALRDGERAYYNPQTEAAPLFEAFQSIPTADEIDGASKADWFTYFSNDPDASGAPDRTIDYIFLPPRANVLSKKVRQDARTISDHLPIVAELQLQ
ncbi:MAG: endonuclease/exonuclease/phosphatase family protein [Myxococcota bacterium]